MSEEVEDLIVEHWERLLQEAFMFARGERLAQLDGRYIKRYDSRGLDTYSLIWGEIQACETFSPTLRGVREVGGIPCDPVSMRDAARRAADKHFAKTIIEKAKQQEEAADAKPVEG